VSGTGSDNYPLETTEYKLDSEIKFSNFFSHEQSQSITI